ncbi:unnamed protein product [Vitrella brassicaformis CCMP3155]|uniref:Uncharacterized protein n=2 Tax=Vitrella brassicaformis TaxID=1169539 RepID=A0A0G4ENG2_VITBC|nr:unnamed protein product [Vitrella brassicaformis CCMP3155]|eukprot:CEL98376.1 unnamed protein product [Vitrella brassicaformis CCMP3155]
MSVAPPQSGRQRRQAVAQEPDEDRNPLRALKTQMTMGEKLKVWQFYRTLDSCLMEPVLEIGLSRAPASFRDRDHHALPPTHIRCEAARQRREAIDEERTGQLRSDMETRDLRSKTVLYRGSALYAAEQRVQLLMRRKWMTVLTVAAFSAKAHEKVEWLRLVRNVTLLQSKYLMLMARRRFLRRRAARRNLRFLIAVTRVVRQLIRWRRRRAFIQRIVMFLKNSKVERGWRALQYCAMHIKAIRTLQHNLPIAVLSYKRVSARLVERFTRIEQSFILSLLGRSQQKQQPDTSPHRGSKSPKKRDTTGPSQLGFDAALSPSKRPSGGSPRSKGSPTRRRESDEDSASSSPRKGGKRRSTKKTMGAAPEGETDEVLAAGDDDVYMRERIDP